MQNNNTKKEEKAPVNLYLPHNCAEEHEFPEIYITPRVYFDFTQV